MTYPNECTMEFLRDALRERGRGDVVERFPLNDEWLSDQAATMLETAVAEFKRGDYLDAITTVERACRPKWSSVRHSESDYDSVMARTHAVAA